MKQVVKKTCDFLLITFLKVTKLSIVFRYGNSLGDQFLMTGLPELIFNQIGTKVIVLTRFSEFFKNNPYVSSIYDYSNWPNIIKRAVFFVLQDSKSSKVFEFRFVDKENTYEEFMRMRGHKDALHISQAFSKHFKAPLVFEKFKPFISFSKEEEIRYEGLFADLPSVYAVIQSEAKKTYTPNKDWGPENVQRVIDLIPSIQFVQVGLISEAGLKRVFDYRGRTGTIRELAWIISRSKFVLGMEGLLNHVAAALSKPSFVIQSGFSSPLLANYATTTVMHNLNFPECSPCWRLDPCDVVGKPCMNEITPEIVSERIKKFLKECIL